MGGAQRSRRPIERRRLMCGGRGRVLQRVLAVSQSV